MTDPLLESWHDYFLMVGGGAAALAGLVFVAMSLNLKTVVEDASHRNRAVGTLSGFTAVFILCGLALMGGQSEFWVGTEWLVVSLVSGAIYINGYVQAVKGGGSRTALSLWRTVFGTACHVGQAIGAIFIISGYALGFSIAGVAMTVFFASLISGAWLLLVGICNDNPPR